MKMAGQKMTGQCPECKRICVSHTERNEYFNVLQECGRVTHELSKCYGKRLDVAVQRCEEQAE